MTHRAPVFSCDDLKVVRMGPVHKERDLNLIGSDSQKRGRGVEDMSKDMVGEGRKTSAGDVNKSKRNWEKRNSKGVSHDGRGVSKWMSLLSRLSPYWQNCSAPRDDPSFAHKLSLIFLPRSSKQPSASSAHLIVLSIDGLQARHHYDLDDNHWCHWILHTILTIEMK